MAFIPAKVVDNPWIDKNLVDSMRQATAERTAVYTAEELDQLFSEEQ